MSDGPTDSHAGHAFGDDQKPLAGMAQAPGSAMVVAAFPTAGSLDQDSTPGRASVVREAQSASARPGQTAGAAMASSPRDDAAADARTLRRLQPMFDPLLETLAAGLDDLEAVRIAQGNRYRILTLSTADSDGETRGFGLDAGHPAVAALGVQLESLEQLEAAMIKAQRVQLRTHPLHPWIKAQVGLGDKQMARLLASIQDPYWNNLHDRPRTVGELWAFCGMHVVAGSAPRRARGQAGNWSAQARMRIWNIAGSCVKQRRSPYRLTYDSGRARYADATHSAPCVRCGPTGHPAPEGSALSDGHKHARAMRLVMKAVLRDLWLESRRIHGGDRLQAAA